MKYFLKFTLFIFLLTLVFSCKKESQVVYQVNDVALYQSAAEKRFLKSETELISIAYSDIFGTSITADLLEKIQGPYIAFGDKATVIDLIIRNFLNATNNQIPGNQQMRANIPQFVIDTYLNLYNRYPDEYESWKLRQMIETDAGITPEMVFYAMMTADEYRYY